ncbi:MAG: hypothetical protein A2135_11505 [Actinobacteria bacterium RBG_16_67_15]|nr:MAG: hypothetical protein A2135_11505 [Actinobacteria bacterium RBG_16_67_15]
MLEEVAAMAATFLLLTVMVQVATAMTARSATDAAVAAATRRAALPETDLALEEARLKETITAIVPGATAVTVDIQLRAEAVVGLVHIEWTPPGPVLVPIDISVTAEVPLAVAP